MTNAVNLSTVAATGFLRNRIINGAMVIDQRNAGASGTAQAYTVDRWGYYATQASKGTWGQNLGSVTPPSGFTNYLGFSSSSAYTVLSGDSFVFNQSIEGFNIADFGWGTAGAQTVTLSFWVRSSITGTHSGSFRNGSVTRSYVFMFTVSAANTWEYKTIVIPGDTSGTWITNNGLGIALAFNLGSGSTYTTTAGSWTAGNFVAATGATSVVGTNGATFYITGVQLEVGTVATPFERRQYGQEFALCQRYFEKFSYEILNVTSATTGIVYYKTTGFKVTKRAIPTVSFANVGTSGMSNMYTTNNINTDNLTWQVAASATGNNVSYYAIVDWTASAEL